MDTTQNGNDSVISLLSRASTNLREFSWSGVTESCGLWQCPLDSHTSQITAEQIECTVCLQPTPSSGLLACLSCRQTTCILCLLRVMQARRADCCALCNRCRRTRCSFCRYEFTNPMIELLEVVYRAHFNDLPFTMATKVVVGGGTLSSDTNDWTNSSLVSMETTVSMASTQYEHVIMEINVVVDRHLLVTLAGAVCAILLYGSLT